MAMVRLTRRVSFSSGHRYWIPSLSEGENRALFGKWASPHNHGHNYVLDVTCEGEVDPATGMVVNIKDIDDILQERIVSVFDGRSINDEIPFFHSHAASLENIVAYLRVVLQNPPLHLRMGRGQGEGGSEPPRPFGGEGAGGEGLRLVGLRLEEMPRLWVEHAPATGHPPQGEGNGRDNGIWTMTLTRTYEFAASHRLYNPSLPHAENEALFGKCANPAGHGHNYILEVTVEGTPDERTGMMIDLEALDAIVEREVVERYDHKNLSVDLPEFASNIATTENVALEIFERLSVLPVRLARVRIHETARNTFEVSAPSPPQGRGGSE